MKFFHICSLLFVGVLLLTGPVTWAQTIRVTENSQHCRNSDSLSIEMTNNIDLSIPNLTGPEFLESGVILFPGNSDGGDLTQPLPYGGGLLRVDQGPGCGGGGDIVKATKQNILEAIRQAREILKNPNLYKIVYDANNFSPDGDLAKKLTYVISLLDYSKEVGPWNHSFLDTPNAIAERIDRIPIFYLEDKPCPSANQDHAEASVSPRSMQGKICFSISELSDQGSDTIGLHVLGLMIHEYTHMLGFNEINADLIQKLFVVAYPHLISSYNSPESRLYRSIIQEVHTWPLTFEHDPDNPFGGPDTEVNDRLLSLLETASVLLRNNLENYPTIKICKYLKDKNHAGIARNFDLVNRMTVVQNIYRSQTNIFDPNDINMFLYAAKLKFFLTHKNSCVPNPQLICDSQQDGIQYLWSAVDRIFDSFNWLLQSSYSYLSFLSETPWVNDPSFEDFRRFKIGALFTQLMNTHEMIQEVSFRISQALFYVSEQNFCTDKPNAKYFKHFSKELVKLQRLMGQLQLSPLERYFREDQIELLDSIRAQALTPDGLNAAEFSHRVREHRDILLTNDFFNHLKKDAFVEKEIFKKFFQEVILFFHGSGFPESDVDLAFDPNEFCYSHKQKEDHLKCLQEATENHKLKRNRLTPPLYKIIPEGLWSK